MEQLPLSKELQSQTLQSLADSDRAVAQKIIETQIRVVCLSMGSTDTVEYSQLMAADVMDLFPLLTIEKIQDVLRRGRQGEFGVYYKINSSVIYAWLTQLYLKGGQSIPRFLH